jgi:MFS family permease
VLQALRVPDFRLLWGGGLISALGSWLLVLALPAHILAATGSLRDTGLALAAEYLPQLALGPVAGAVADRWDRRRLMTGANLFCAGVVAVMLLGTAPGRIWVLYVALAAENSGTVLYAPAAQARTPAVVGTGPLLASANSLTAAGNGIVRVIGGPLGGVLLAACGIRWLICADAVSYLLAAAAVGMMSRSADSPLGRAAASGAAARGLAEGWRALRAQPAARALLPVVVVFLAANASLSAVLIPFGIQRLGGSEHTGLLLSCLGAGLLLGAPVIRVLLDRAGPRNLLTASLTATAGGYLLLFTSSSLAVALPAATAVGMSGSMAVVVQQTTVQRLVPGAVLGRVSAVFLTGAAAATLAGSVAGPFLAQAAGLTAAAAAAGLLTLGAAALAFRTVPAASQLAWSGNPPAVLEKDQTRTPLSAA